MLLRSFMMLFTQITRKKTNTKKQSSFNLTLQDLEKDGSPAAGTQGLASSKQTSGVTTRRRETKWERAELKGSSGREPRRRNVTHADVTHAHAASLTLTQPNTHAPDGMSAGSQPKGSCVGDLTYDLEP